ncbi:MAG: DNA/RNA non-specific endonuclease [Acidobacteria bacterium]|nr:DNA/RNA non-specific endonuclease [Acidobacteriota bacterium]MCA1638871.1 DNA/RNA non-specific endonuclease [Acidobacteriota bacterium]
MSINRSNKKEQINRVLVQKNSFFRQSVSFAILAFLFLQQLLIISPVTAQAAVSTSIVISQFQVAGGTAADEFVELHNVGNNQVDIKDYRLVYRSATGVSDVAVTNWTSSTIIPAGGYYLIAATPGYDGGVTVAADKTFADGGTGKLAAAGGGFALYNGATNSATIIDSVGYGTATNAFIETTRTTAPAANTSMARKSAGCADTDNNSNDFESVNPSTPRNSLTTSNVCSAISTSTNPAGTGTANPNSVIAGNTTLLTVSVTPGTNPSSSGISVTADLSAIGGVSNQAFAGSGNSFSFTATVAANTTAGLKTLPVTINDAEGRTGRTSISLTVEQTSAVVDHVVISQIYGGGGNSGATYTNDYVELYNPSMTSFNLNGWSLQYASATGSGWGSSTQPLGGAIAPGEYYLVSLASGGAVGQPLPPANITGGETNLSGTSGKIALVRNGEPLTGANSACPLDDSDIVDFVGYGSANCSEGATKAPTASSTQAIFRKSGGSTDTNVNGSDFTVQPASPRRTAVIAEIGPSVSSSDPRQSGTNAPRDASITVNFTEAVNVDPVWFSIVCNGVQHNDATVAVSSNFKSYVITPNTSFVPGEQCSVTINKNAIHDQDTDDSAPNTDTLAADYSWSFTVATGSAPPYPSSVHLTMGNPSDATANIGEPNNYLMEKDAFALSYNRDGGTPNWVSWHLDKLWTGNLQRNDSFRPDPEVPSDWYRVQPMDYFGSGFDRGHMTPNADRDNENSIPLNQETFLMTNIVPQAPDNNQGPWANMENDLRSLFTDASGNEYELYIVAGGAGVGGTGSNGSITTTIADGRVTVPQYTWKVALVLPRGDNDVSRVNVATRTIAVIMPNTQGIRNDDWKKYLTSVDAVESLTGYDFFSNVSDDIENSIEAGINGANPPVAESQSVTASEDTPQAITLSAMSANNNPLTYTIVSQPANGVLNGSGSSFTYIPKSNFYGVDSFTFRVNDGLFNSNVATVTINVASVNDAPMLATIGNKTVNEDTPLTFTASATDSDVPANALNFSLVGAPTGASINSSTGVFTWTSTEPGIYTFTVRVTDDGNPALSDLEEITVTVLDTTAPTITIASPTAVNYLLNQNVLANYSCSDTGSGVASCIGTVANGAAIDTTTTGTKTFSVMATDNAGNTKTQTVTYTIGFGVVVLFDQTKQYNSGSTIPIKLQIVDAAGTNQSAANIAVTAVRIMPGNLPVQSAGNSQPGNLFKYEDGVYQFNLQTSRDMAAGTYQLVFRIAGDPIEHSVQFVIR